MLMPSTDSPAQALLPFGERNLDFPRRLSPVLQHHNQEPIIVVECDAKGMDVEPVLRAAKQLAAAGVHGVSVSDNALASLRMCSVCLSHLIQEVAGIRAVCHKSCRDINLLGMHSLMIGASRLEVNTILAITGDKIALGDFAGRASGVFDINSLGLVKLLSNLNEGRSMFGDNLSGPPAKFEIAVGFNPNVFSLSAEISRLEQKIALGADFALSQLVFDCKVIQKMYEATEHLGIPILVGLMPFVSLRNARYINEKIMNDQVPPGALQRMGAVEGDASAQQAEGLAICKEQIDAALSLGAPGFYFVTPFGRVEMVLELVQYVKDCFRKANWTPRKQSPGPIAADEAAA
jgi:5,10-methylenetetrahydrofolate reductase